MISIVLAGRNDDYGTGFRERLFRTTDHNTARLAAAGIDFEFILGEWNPLPGRPPLAEEFVNRVPRARAVIIPAAIHDVYSLNPAMPFHEMPAKNAALRRAAGEFVIATNADVLFGDCLIERIASGPMEQDKLYRAHRIDVAPSLSWAEMQDTSNQLPSGEGRQPPCWYLGAGGDFCMASGALWQRLRGFDERVRFSTRAKDWQFYLSAGARGIQVEYIGEVYHLDHAIGFRNTAPGEADRESAHFGGLWDIEFGLPFTNPESWGFHGLGERAYKGDERIVVVEANGYCVAADQDKLDRKLAGWLSRPSKEILEDSARLFHAICLAQQNRRRLIFRLQDVQLAIALSGFDPVASTHGLPVFCNWTWPALPGFTSRAFKREPAVLDEGDWVAEKIGGRLLVTEHGTGRRIEIEPRRFRVDRPPFNPLMVRRMLHAILRLQKCGARRLGIYGGGGHTRDLLRWGLPDAIQLVAIVVSEGGQGTLSGVPIVSLADIKTMELDAILLSSASFETEMMEQTLDSGVPNVLAMYQDWPAEMSMAD